MVKNRKVMAVYEIRNLVTGKFYIGSSSNMYERFRTHRKKLRQGSHPNPHLQASWNKHGERVFEFTKLAEFESIEDMFVCEAALIEDSIDKPECFNMARWVDTPMRGRVGPLHHNHGKPISDGQRSKLREAALRQWANNDPRTGKKHSDETKVKISSKVQKALAEGRGGRFIPSEETRSKMSAAAMGNSGPKGHVRSVEHRARLSEANRGNKNWLGKSHSEESRDKMGRSIVSISPDGVETPYPTITKLRSDLGLTPPTINRALKSGEPLKKGARKGWSFRYS